MKDLKILFQGDSITDCGRARNIDTTNTQMGDGYATIAAGRMLKDFPDKNLQLWNRGIGGNRVVDLYSRWKIDAINLKPDILSILIGVNDTWHEFGSQNGVEVPRYEQIYRMILEWTLKELPDIKIVLLEPFVLEFGAVKKEWVPEMDQRRAVVRRLSQDFGTIFVALQEKFHDAAAKTGPEYWLRDGVHPTYAGHTLIADEWVKTVSKLI